MVILNKIYTRRGDKGQTDLGNGSRVDKFSLRVEAYGTVDELNSTIGLAILKAKENLKEQLLKIQNDLFDLGADLCVPEENFDDSKKSRLRINKVQTLRLEKEIDQTNKNLESLTSFILPGGSELAASLHFCRTVCRRAERLTVNLSRQEIINEEAITYLNRLSDWFFVMGRSANDNGTNDILWNPGLNR